MHITKQKISILFGVLGILTFSFVSNIYAREVKIADLLAKEDITGTSADTTSTKELELELPTQTDNPSQVITFKDPSDKGVALSIDGKSAKEIDSPYTLPALSIGKHSLVFKFVDSLGIEQELEKEVIIIPRVPVINVPKVDGESVVVSGTGLADAEIFLLISADGKTETLTGNVDSDGKWTLTLETKIVDGIHTFVAYVRKYGYASDLSEIVKADLSATANVAPTKEEKKLENIHFAFADITKENWKEVLGNNKDLYIVTAGALLLGVVITAIFSNIVDHSIENREVKKAEKDLLEPSAQPQKDLTLFDILSQEIKETPQQPQVVQQQVVIPQQEVEQPVVEKVAKKRGRPRKAVTEVEAAPIQDLSELKSAGKVITRIDFLRDYKDFDPDKSNGQENDLKKQDNIEISLISKK